MVWYSHLFQNFPQFIVIHTVKGFGIVTKAEIGVFLKLSCFFYDSSDVGNLISPTRDQTPNPCIGRQRLTTGPPERSLQMFIECH